MAELDGIKANGGDTSKPSITECKNGEPGSGSVYVNPDHSTECSQKMVAFWRKSQFCDVNMVILNTTGTPTACVAAHRVVIASAIPFFAVMFGTRMDNTNDKEISLHGYESTVVKSFIEYAYTGKIEITESNVKEVLVTAKRFTLPDIVSFCVGFLSSNISPSNCIGIHKFSQAQELKDLQVQAEEYIIQHFPVVTKEEEFLLLPVEKVVEYVKSDDILVDSEEDVYNAVTKWIHHDFEARAKHSDDLYHHVRFPITSQRFLETVALKNELLSTDRGKVYLKDGFEYHENPAAIMFSSPKKTHPRRSVQGIICVVGGESSSNVSLTSLTLFNPHEQEWKEGPSMNNKRSRLAVAFLQGELYAIGGYDLGYSLTHCEKYSPAENRWLEIAPLNTARSGLAIVPVGNKLFAMGGSTGSVHLHSVEVYNPQTDEWTSGPPMLEARSELCTVFLNQYVYAIGGCNSTGDLRSVERFDLMNKKWEFISSMNTPRTGAAATLLGNEILVCGGKGDQQIINMAEAYDTETDLWEPVVSVMNNARVNFAMVSLSGAIYALGGSNLSGYLDSIEYYDPHELAWVESIKLPCCRFAPAAVILSRKELNQ